MYVCERVSDDFNPVLHVTEHVASLQNGKMMINQPAGCLGYHSFRHVSDIHISSSMGNTIQTMFGALPILAPSGFVWK